MMAWQQIYQARNELKSTKLKLDDIDQTVRQRYDKVVYKMDKTLKTLDKLLGKSDSHDSTAAFLGSHRGDKSNNSDSDSSNDENDSYGNSSITDSDDEHRDKPDYSDTSSDSSTSQNDHKDSDESNNNATPSQVNASHLQLAGLLQIVFYYPFW